MAIRRIFQICAASALASLATAHGGEHQKPIQVDADADWATRHMAGKPPPSVLTYSKAL